MSIHLPNGSRLARPADGRPGTWVDVQSLEHIGVEVKDLGDGRIGLCPSPERCVQVPDQASHGRMVDLASVADELGFVIADDGHHAVVRHAPDAPHPTGPGHPTVGDELDLTLSDLDGHDRPVVPPHGRAAVFAWASW